MEARLTGVTIKHLPKEALLGIPIPLPPLEEQHRIVARVGGLMALCDEIEQSQEATTTLRAEASRSALAAIVESDRSDSETELRIIQDHLRLCLESGEGAPKVVGEARKSILDLAVRGRLTYGQADDAEPRVADAQARRSEWTSPTAPDKRNTTKVTGYPLGSQIPRAAWVMAGFDALAELVNGRAYKKTEWETEGAPVIRIQNLTGGTDSCYLTLRLPDHNYCNDGDFLFARSASFGPFLWSGPRAIFHHHIWRVVLSPVVLPPFLYLLLRAVTDAVRSASHGLAMLHVTKAGMEGLVAPLPPLAEQARIVARVQELDERCDEIEAAVITERELAGEFADSAIAALLAEHA